MKSNYESNVLKFKRIINYTSKTKYSQLLYPMHFHFKHLVFFLF